MARYGRFVAAGGVLSVLAAAAVMASVTTYTGTGDNFSDAQTWTFQGELTYSAGYVSGGVIEYAWGQNAAHLVMAPDVHYEDADVYYRMAIVYDVTTVVWQSSPQDNMERLAQLGSPYSEEIRTPTPGYWQGSDSLDVIYKVQTAPAQNTQIEAKQFTLAKSA